MDPNTSMSNAQNPDSEENFEEAVTMEKTQSVTSEEPPHGDTEPPPHSPLFTARYYSVMEDDCPDEVFTPPSSLPSHSEPEGGSTCEAAASVCLRSSDGTEPSTNPECLDWPHEEKQLMTSRNQVNKEMESVLTAFEEVVRSDSSSETEHTGQDQDVLEDSFKIQDLSSSEEEVEEYSNAEIPKDVMSEDTSDLLDDIGLTHQTSERLNLASQTETEDNQNTMEVTLKQSPDNSQEEGSDGKLADALDNELTGYDWVRRTGVEDDGKVISGEHRGLEEQEETAEALSESRIATEILQGESLLQRLQLVQQRQDLDDICSHTPNMEEDRMTNVASETIQDIQQEERSDQESQTGSPSMTGTAKFEEFGIHKTEVVSWNEGIERRLVNLTVTCAHDDVCKKLEQDGLVQKFKEFGLEDEHHVVDKQDDEERFCVEERCHSDYEEDEEKAEERTFLPPLSPEQTDDRDEDYAEGFDTSKDDFRIPFPPCHRLSAAETHMEKQLQESSQIKQDLQRAKGMFDLSENPDILEIPFKTNISLEALQMREESFPTGEQPSQTGDFHFSEQKMQKEISQEMQRELVLVNMGKIPGEYSKGESRQMKATKLLFEAFQQEKTEGPTRIRKPLVSQSKSQVYPSVLERTRSLEMFSQKISPMFRTHSFRLVSQSEKEKCPETFRPLSPSTRDKTRLSPYPKHEKHPRMHKSMDSLNMTSPTGARSSKREPAREGSPLLKENPFFKLRPALSLQPEVEKDIREAKKREEELRKQRSSLYGETKHGSKEEGRSTAELKADLTQKTTGRLERVWPPPSKKDPAKTEQQEAKVQRGLGQRTALWQRWESGLINGQTSAPNNKNNKD